MVWANNYTLKGIADLLTENTICDFSKVTRTKFLGGNWLSWFINVVKFDRSLSHFEQLITSFNVASDSDNLSCW